MAAQQQGAHRVADLLVAHQAALIVGCAQEHPEHVLAVELIGAAALGDLFHHDRVDRVDRAADSWERFVPPVLTAGRDYRLEEEPPRVALGKQRERRRAQPVYARGVGDPEHRGHDHLEADRFHVRLGGRGVPVGPACESLFGLALHRLVVAAQRVAMERGELHSPFAHVLGSVEVRESRRAKEEMVRGGLGQRRSKAKHIGVGCEDTLDVLGIGQA